MVPFEFFRIFGLARAAPALEATAIVSVMGLPRVLNRASFESSCAQDLPTWRGRLN